jgi:hypothetical protein
MRLVGLALVASLGVVAAACSSSGNGAVSTAAPSSTVASSSTAASGSSASSATSDPRTQQQIDADRAAAQAAVLKLSDLPAGWMSRPSTATSGGDAVQAQMAACLGVDSSFFKNSDKARVQSDDFDDPTVTMEVSNTVTVTPSSTTGNSVMDVFSRPEVPGCLGQAMDQAINQQATASGSTLPAGTTIGKAQVAPESFPNVADRTTAYRVTVPVTTSGQSINITIDYVIFVKGRTGATLTLQGNGEVVPTSLAASLAQTVAGRMPSS